PVPDDAENRNRESNAEHKEIVKAMLDKNTDAAVEVLTRHLTRNYGSSFRQSLDLRTMDKP
ncbi:MAG: FCD domain-containing protein, partial [Geminicoccaceae bacterium]